MHPIPLTIGMVDWQCPVLNDTILYLPLLIIGYPLTKSDVKRGKSSGTFIASVLNGFVII